MIQFNNQNTWKSIHYGGHDIKAVYNSLGKVWPPQSPFKWLATYADSHIESAECDSTSAITSGEINLTNLVSVEIGDCVTSIGGSAFRECTSLTSIEIPDSVTSIDVNAFRYCTRLTSCTIGSGVTTIADDVFRSCTSLTSIEIPDSVTSIGETAFAYCTRLTSCTIGSGITSIGGSAFWHCDSFLSITCNAITPPTLGDNDVFANTNNCPIYVPCQSIEAYKTAWSAYEARIQCVTPPPIPSDYFIIKPLETVTIAPPNGYRILDYSIDEGETWTELRNNVTFSGGSVVRLKLVDDETQFWIGYQMRISGRCETEGNLECLRRGYAILNISGMFGSCTGLTNAERLIIPASANCYSMFEGCTSLITPPQLTATTLTVDSCYNSMFRGCTSLTTAPTLPATTLSNYCYSHMFARCTSLNEITCLATTISEPYTDSWLVDVAPNGTFKTPSSTNWESGVNGIPSGWTRVDI